jgi:hypothetical protein
VTWKEGDTDGIGHKTGIIIYNGCDFHTKVRNYAEIKELINMKLNAQRSIAAMLSMAMSVTCLSALPAFAQDSEETAPQLTAEEIAILNNAGVTNEMIAQILAPPSRDWTGHNHYAQFLYSSQQHEVPASSPIIVPIPSGSMYPSAEFFPNTLVSNYQAPLCNYSEYHISYYIYSTGYWTRVRTILNLNTPHTGTAQTGTNWTLSAPILMGDPNQTDTLDIYDLLLVAQQAAHTISLTGDQLLATDIDCDGDTDDTDTGILANYLARNIEYFWT